MKKIDSGIFNKTRRSRKRSNDEIILDFLRKVGRAVPPVAIFLCTHLHPTKISQRLQVLRRYGKVRVFYRKLPLYTIRRDKNGS